MAAAFHRTDMLPPQPAPAGQTGAIRWLRENLFAGWFNSLLTIGCIVFVVWAIQAAGPWFWNGIWYADSLDECREVRDRLYGEGTSVACWAVIPDRWAQLLFGFFPQGETWRPVLALGLFCAAVAPVLFPQLPRQLLLFAPIAPFLIYFLLWGGSLWGPVCAALGFGLILFGWRAGQVIGEGAGLLVALIVAVGYWGYVTGDLANWLEARVWIPHLTPVSSRDFGGFTLSFVIGATGIVLSLPLGIVLALGRQSDMFIIKRCSVAFIEVIRGVPLIVWLFTASLLLNYFLPPGTTFDLMLRVIIMVTLFSSAYIAEIVRGGLAALPKGQYEAADALGLDYWKSMQLIVLPQALKVSIPGIVGSFIGLFKDTTLVSFVGLFDPINLANAIRADADWHGVVWEIYIFIGVIFFIACFAMSRYSQALERRLQRDHR